MQHPAQERTACGPGGAAGEHAGGHGGRQPPTAAITRALEPLWRISDLWLSGRQRVIALVALAVVAAPLVAWGTARWSEREAYGRLSAQAVSRLALYGATLENELEKYRNVPLVLASDPEVMALLDAPGPSAIDHLNRRLTSINQLLGAADIYLMNVGGRIIASSNWDQGEGSSIGQQLDFRPYFIMAKEGRLGRYFSVGTTAGIAGYFLAMPVHRGDEVIGVVTVKLTMDSLERGWAGGGERVFVTDPRGVVFITNTPTWRFHSLQPLASEDAQAIRAVRQYGDRAITPLAMTRENGLIRLDGESYVMATLRLADANILHVLVGVTDARARARELGVMAALIFGSAIVGLLSLAHWSSLRRHHTRELEQRVIERTAELRAEIVERRRAEEELKAKQEELVQTAKLAALGQMSAGMTHEINQPLAAIRSYAETAAAFLNLGRIGEVAENLSAISDLVERLGRITGQLRQFARKASGRPQAVSITNVVDDSLSLMGGRLRSSGIDVAWMPPQPDIPVWAEDVRLQQVMINLFRNAVDAMRDSPERRLSLAIRADGEWAVLEVRDSGSGIAADAMAQLFDPFFTTKPAGEGLGLGLSISEGIVRAMGGQLSARNHPEGGAVFSVTLKRADAGGVP